MLEWEGGERGKMGEGASERYRLQLQSKLQRGRTQHRDVVIL